MDARQLQSVRDDEHLRILSIVSYVFGGIGAVFGLIPLIHVGIGAVILAAPTGPDGPPRAVGILLIVLGAMIILVAEIFAALKIYLGYCLARRRNRIGCMVMAAILCIGFPYGTALGVLTLVVLTRESVRDRFDAGTGVPVPAAAI